MNITSSQQAKKAYRGILDAVEKNCPDANIRGILVQEMVKEGIEAIVGYEDHEVFGPSILFGIGGIFTELFQDISFRLLPIKKKDAIAMVKDLKFSHMIEKGYRNIPACSLDMIAELLLAVGDMALDLQEKVSSFDINPVVLYADDYRVIDFKAALKKDKTEKKENRIFTKDIDKFFNAQSVALIGASEVGSKIGTLIMDSLKNHGYRGKIYPINPKYGTVMGLPAHKSILEIEDDIDLLLISISLERIPDILQEADKKNIRNVIIISAGGKEIGNKEIEDKIKKTAQVLGVRIMGCNCLGVFNGYTRLDTLFTPNACMARPPAGPISFITQSGTVGISFLELLGDYGMAKFASYGNRIDVDEADLITYLSEDDKTSVISMYIEGLEKGRKFYESARSASKKKPILVYKAGRSPEASKAASSHTGFLSGTYSLIKGAMDQANIISVDNFESLLASAKALSVYGRGHGNRVMTVTNGAGAMIQALDRIGSKNKLVLAELSQKTKDSLQVSLPLHATIANPIDISGSSLDEHYEQCIGASIEDKNVDILIVWFVFQVKTITEGMAQILEKYFRLNQKPILCGAFGKGHTWEMGGLIEQKGIPIYYSIEETISAAESIAF